MELDIAIDLAIFRSSIARSGRFDQSIPVIIEGAEKCLPGWPYDLGTLRMDCGIRVISHNWRKSRRLAGWLRDLSRQMLSFQRCGGRVLYVKMCRLWYCIESQLTDSIADHGMIGALENLGPVQGHRNGMRKEAGRVRTGSEGGTEGK
jgi:hypothetical protein